MWKKYDALPDLNLVQGLYDEFYELSGSFSMDIFFIYSIAMHIEKLEYRNLDGFMQDLYMARNLSKPISESLNIHNPEEIKYIENNIKKFDIVKYISENHKKILEKDYCKIKENLEQLQNMLHTAEQRKMFELFYQRERERTR